MALSDFKVTAVVPVTDLERACDFYENTLGLSRAENYTGHEGEVLYQCGGDTCLQIYVSLAGASPSGATVATWEVDDLDMEMDWFRNEGVQFEDYDFPEFQTVNGKMEDELGSAAWFKDPDGNILCLHQTY